MTSDQLISTISLLRSKTVVIQLAKQLKGDDAGMKILYKLIEKNPENVADKASWVARTWFDIHKIKELSWLKLNLKVLEKATSDPVIRNLTGIFVDIGYPNSFESKITNLCFNWLSDYSRASAVHGNALFLLTPILKKYPELKHEVIYICEAHPLSAEPTFRWRLQRALSLDTNKPSDDHQLQ